MARRNESQNESFIIDIEPDESGKFHEPLYCVKYNPDDMNFDSWLRYFDGFCRDNGLNDTWKLKNVANFLRGKALSVVINECSECNTISEIFQILREKFIRMSVANFSEFTNLRLSSPSEIETYFQRKLEIGRKLGLSDKLIIQGLTDGLTPEYKNLLITNEPGNPIEWFKIVSKLISSSMSNTSLVTNSVTTVQNLSRIQEVPTSLNTNTGVNENSHYSGRNQRNRGTNFRYRQWTRPLDRNNYGNTIHYHNNIPPRPCRICTNRGIVNAFHWENDCFFRQNTSVAQNPATSNLPQIENGSSN